MGEYRHLFYPHGGDGRDFRQTEVPDEDDAAAQMFTADREW